MTLRHAGRAGRGGSSGAGASAGASEGGGPSRAQVPVGGLHSGSNSPPGPILDFMVNRQPSSLEIILRQREMRTAADRQLTIECCAALLAACQLHRAACVLLQQGSD